MPERPIGPDAEILERDAVTPQEPDQLRVVILNDDYTPMEFVVLVLESIFQKSPALAYGIMMRVHREGRGVAGVYPPAQAQAKVDEVHHEAQSAGYPLRAVVESAGGTP